MDDGANAGRDRRSESKTIHYCTTADYSYQKENKNNKRGKKSSVSLRPATSSIASWLLGWVRLASPQKGGFAGVSNGKLRLCDKRALPWHWGDSCS